MKLNHVYQKHGLGIVHCTIVLFCLQFTVFCRCKKGWRGENCDECIPSNGCNLEHGTCQDEPFECICKNGWIGPYCDCPRCAAGQILFSQQIDSYTFQQKITVYSKLSMLIYSSN